MSQKIKSTKVNGNNLIEVINSRNKEKTMEKKEKGKGSGGVGIHSGPKKNIGGELS